MQILWKTRGNVWYNARMIVKAYKTHKITKKDTNLFKILDTYLPKIEENSVVAITSKIVAICEGRMVKIEEADKDELIESEAQYLLSREKNPYHISLTITRNTLVVGAGVDESNANGYYILWPANPQETANKVREYLCNKYSIKNVGVIITDSKTTPFRWGVTAIALAYSGFNALKNYIGTKDLFGREFQYEQMSIIDSFATSAALVMGEGSESTPLSVITDIPFVEFQGRNPTQEEIDYLQIDFESDIYSPIISNAPWKKGKAGK